MNTACLVVSRMSLAFAFIALGAYIMSGVSIYLVLVAAFAALTVVFESLYRRHKHYLRSMGFAEHLEDTADAVDTHTALADLLEPDE